MMYLGDFAEDQTVRFHWGTTAIAGESITRATNGTISVYKDGNTTQTTTGVTDTEDFDTLTGVHYCAIATTDAFYVAGSEYTVILSGATIDGKVINTPLAHFSIERTGGALALLKSGTYGLSAAKTVQDAIKAKTDNLPSDPADASVIAGRFDTLDTSVADLPTNAELASAFTEIKGATWSAVTDTLEAIRDRGDAAWITATGFSTHSAADVWSVATRILTAGTNISLAKGVGVTGFNDLSAAQVNTEVDTAISDAALATAANLATVDTVVDAIKLKTDSLNFTVAGQVNANIKYVADTAINGVGTEADPWGP